MPRLTTERLWAVAIPLLVFFLVSTSPITPNDFWWHLRAGQDLITSGHIPTVDDYSVIMQGASYSNYAAYWLMEAAFYWIYTAGGPQLVLLAHSLVVTLAYTLLMCLCWQLSGSWRIAAASTVFAVAIGTYAWAVRPQVIAFPLGVLVLWAIYTYRRKPRPWLLAVFPLTMLLWVNSHGSFVIELVMLAVWLTADVTEFARDRLLRTGQAQARRLWPSSLALITTTLAAQANPRGFAGFAYVFSLASNPVIENLVPEWAPATVETRYGAVFLIGLLFSIVVLAVSPKRPGAHSILTFVVFAVLSLWTARGIVWFGIAMAPVLAQHLDASAASFRALRTAGEAPAGSGKPVVASTRVVFVNYVLLGVLLLGAILALPWFKQALPLPDSRTSVIAPETPVAATRFLLAERPPGLIFNDLVFGSYLIWAAQPAYPVFADPRLELYSPDHWLDYLAISAGQPGWEQNLDAYSINTIMLNPAEQQGLVDQARNSPAWRLLYEDPTAIIFVRRQGRS